MQTALPITSPSTALSGGLGEGGDDGNAEVTQVPFGGGMFVLWMIASGEPMETWREVIVSWTRD